MKDSKIENGTIKQGQFILIWDGHSSWVRRKVLFVQMGRNGEENYIVKKHRDQGIVYREEVKLINSTERV